MRVEHVHRGASFDVYRLLDREGAWAFKVPAEHAGVDEQAPTRFTMSAKLGGVSTIWDLHSKLHAERPSSVDGERSELRAFLEDEAARIQSTDGAWNHEVRCLAEYELPRRGPSFGLCTRWFEGTPLGALPRAQQRALFPRMLPALWDALGAALHGDLHAGNLIIASDRFALIDPGAMRTRSWGPAGPSSGGSALSFITHGASYPVLAPFCHALAPGARLADHWAALIASLTASHHYPPVRAGAHTMMREVSGLPNLAPPRPDGRPLPADLLAAGILYYDLLTGRHPFPAAVAGGPAWASLQSLDDHVTGGEIGAACLASPPPPPRTIDPAVSQAEERLAMALLDLAVSSRAELEALASAALRQHA